MLRRVVFVIFTFLVFFTTSGNAAYGCHRGYCWANCIGPAGFAQYLFKSGRADTDWAREWCYTTMGNSQNYKYVRCLPWLPLDQCSPDWSCAGPCTI